MSEPRGDCDADVIAASQSDPARFASVVDAHGDAVIRYLTRRVGPTVGEDLAAETFLAAFRGRGAYRPDHETALPWLYGIATNLLRNHARSEQRRIEVLGRLAAQAAFEDGQQRVDDAMTAAATIQKLASAFEALSADGRDAVVLVAVEGLTYEEAATALRVPVGTIRSRLSRARNELRRSLAGIAELPAGDDRKPDAHEGTNRGR